MKENQIKIGKLTLCCLCGKHKKNSTCEVYLRNHGRWENGMEKMDTKRLIQFLKEQGLPSLAKALQKLSK